MTALTADRFITIEGLIERVVHALRSAIPFGLTRWADGENLAMSLVTPQPPGYVFAHLEHRLTACFYDDFKGAFLHGVRSCDVLGVYVEDAETTAILTRLGDIDLEKSLVYAWCNKHWNARREWAEEVLEKPRRVSLIGNRMSDYRSWLIERFPRLDVVQCDTARDWPDVTQAMTRLQALKPQLALISAGWFTACLVGAARDAGAVAISYGHCPDYHLEGKFLPNVCCPRGPQGCTQHYAHEHLGAPNTDCILQEREIVLC